MKKKIILIFVILLFFMSFFVNLNAEEQMGRESVDAKARALLAATEGHWLVLAGNRGTGKSHLAVAIMLESSSVFV